MLNVRLEKAIVFLLFVLVAATPLFYFKQSVFPYSLPKTAFFEGLIEIIFFLWLALAIIDRHYRPRRTPLLAALAVFLGAMLLTGFLGEDPSRSFWSTQERLLGVFAFLHLGALVLVLSSLRSRLPWRRLIYASVIVAALAAILAMVQLKVPTILLDESNRGRPGGTFGNPAFLSGYLLFNVFLGSYLGLSKLQAGSRSRESGVWFPLLLAVICAVGVFVTQTRSDILALGLGILFLGAAFAIRPPAIRPAFLARRGTYIALLILILAAASLFWFTRTSAVWEGVPGLQRFREIAYVSQNEAVLPRLAAMRAAWSGFWDKPLLGWGWDNFNLVFNKHYEPSVLRVSYQETRFDKPHNFILEYMTAGGVVLLLAFLALVAAFLWEIQRGRDRLWAQFAAATLSAYFLRNLFFFDTLGPAMMLYFLFGLSDNLYLRAEPEAEKVQPRKFAPVAEKLMLAAAVVLSLISVYQINYLSVRGGYYQFWGFKYFVRGRPADAVQSFKRASLETWTPYAGDFIKDYASTVTDAFFYNPGLIPPEEMRAALQAMETVAAAHPQDAFYHQILVDMYNQASSLDLQNFTAAAERHAQAALSLSPKRQEILFSLAKTKSLEGDNAAAMALAKQGIELEPLVPDGHFYYGLLAFVDGQSELGYQEIKRALELGRKWKSFYEPRVVANFFADAGHLEEAIELYQVSLGMRDEPETRVKLGIAYFYAGQPDLAREEIRRVMAETDLTQSPAWPSLTPFLRELQLLQD